MRFQPSSVLYDTYEYMFHDIALPYDESEGPRKMENCRDSGSRVADTAENIWRKTFDREELYFMVYNWRFMKVRIFLQHVIQIGNSLVSAADADGTPLASAKAGIVMWLRTTSVRLRSEPHRTSKPSFRQRTDLLHTMIVPVTSLLYLLFFHWLLSGEKSEDTSVGIIEAIDRLIGQDG